jgi:hypothetical protein
MMEKPESKKTTSITFSSSIQITSLPDPADNNSATVHKHLDSAKSATPAAEKHFSKHSKELQLIGDTVNRGPQLIGDRPTTVPLTSTIMVVTD